MVASRFPNEDLTEIELASEIRFKGRLLEVREDEVRLPNGKRATREYVRHPGAVMMLALFDDGSVLLERQFRYPLRRAIVELPAGKIEPAESPLATAQRELLEETGFEAGTWRHLVTMHPCVGYSDERIELYLARNLVQRGHPGEEDEFLEVLAVPLSEALSWVRDGAITDSKTILGLFWAEKIRDAGW